MTHDTGIQPEEVNLQEKQIEELSRLIPNDHTAKELERTHASIRRGAVDVLVL